MIRYFGFQPFAISGEAWEGPPGAIPIVKFAKPVKRTGRLPVHPLGILGAAFGRILGWYLGGPDPATRFTVPTKSPVRNSEKGIYTGGYLKDPQGSLGSTKLFKKLDEGNV